MFLFIYIKQSELPIFFLALARRKKKKKKLGMEWENNI